MFDELESATLEIESGLSEIILGVSQLECHESLADELDPYIAKVHQAIDLLSEADKILVGIKQSLKKEVQDW